ncbi:hypothetical protein [Bacillus toyonensis]|uniref:hypothetical protein n=1 Tax=Bacillus toyonensis TaxID=155322 RepID=UPI000BFBB2C2|nr:hypothetical protein [Bacillus toyonensis]PHC13444.1 hypothetical protein COF03_26265 [Bacillus toyonensis]
MNSSSSIIELINYIISSDLFKKSFTSVFMPLIIVVITNIITTKIKKSKIDSELANAFKEIINQRNIPKVKLKISKSFNRHIVSLTMTILFSKESKERKKQKTEESDKNRLIISALFLESKLKKIYKTYFIIGFGSILLLGMSRYVNVPSYIYVIPLLFAILTCSYQFLLNYRIKNGLFGTNDYEAKELIEFIIQNNDKVNGNKIFNEEAVSKTIIDFSNYVKKVHLLHEH